MTGEEKAIPEPILVKRQMLEAYSNASLNLSQYLERKEKKFFITFNTWVCDLFFWLEAKIDFKKKQYDCLKKLQAYIYNPNGTLLTYQDWINCWFALRLKMEELNITKIEMEEEDVYTLLKRP